MVAISFKEQHADKVESGKKLMTIRPTKRVKAGDKLQLYPAYNSGVVDASCRDLVWQDVPYKAAPRALISQFKQELKV